MSDKEIIDAVQCLSHVHRPLNEHNTFMCSKVSTTRIFFLLLFDCRCSDHAFFLHNELLLVCVPHINRIDIETIHLIHLFNQERKLFS